MKLKSIFFIVIFIIFYRNERLLIKKFSDMKVKVEGEEIETVKCIFSDKNQYLNQIIMDEKFNGCLELPSECSKEGFYELERYYNVGDVDINVDNCLDVLTICIIYKEMDLIKKCEDFIINMDNDDILYKIIKNKLILGCNDLNKIKEYVCEYIKRNKRDLLDESIL